MKNILRRGFVAVFHLLLIVFLLISPWLIFWPYIVLIFVLYRLQLLIFKACLLSQLQFGTKNEGFYYHYIKKIYPNIKSTTIDLFVDTIMPLVIIIFAYILQS